MTPTKPTVKEAFELIFSDRNLLGPIAWIFAATLCICWGVLIGINEPTALILEYFSASCFFASFDCLGFGIGIQYADLDLSENDPNFAELIVAAKKRLLAYRITQTMFQHIVGLLTLLISWKLTAVYYATWWCGGYDLLFYAFRLERFYEWHDLYWLRFTLFGIFSHIKIGKLDLRYSIEPWMLLVSGGGSIVGSIIFILF